MVSRKKIYSSKWEKQLVINFSNKLLFTAFSLLIYFFLTSLISFPLEQVKHWHVQKYNSLFICKVVYVTSKCHLNLVSFSYSCINYMDLGQPYYCFA